MDALIRHCPAVQGTLVLPADKAICHRAALLCALANGSTELTPWSTAEDCQRTLGILQQLGVEIRQTPSGIQIHGKGLTGLQAPQDELDCGESGTTMRLAAGLLAGQPFTSRLTARASLQQRPMHRIIEPLTKMGADIGAISLIEPREDHPSEDYPPLEIRGRFPLRGMTYTMPVASAQVKSAILFAALFANGPTTIVEPVPTRDHTERLLTRLGVAIRRDGHAMTLEPPRQKLSAPGALTIPGDLSSAAFFVVAASIVPASQLVIRDVGLNPTRIQFLHVLKRMGACVEWTIQDEPWEPRGTITVKSAKLHGTTVEATEAALLIDELPILMVAACAAEGETVTRLRGIQELRVKETDRLESMCQGLSLLNARLITSPDGSDVIIHGNKLLGRTVESHQDHRTAMSLAIAGLLAEGETRVRNAGCIAKSLGNFFELLAAVTPPGTVKTIDND